MNFIYSQDIKTKLTHLTSKEGYDGMIKNGIILCVKGGDMLVYKPNGFWISVNGDWERWCGVEEFRDVKSGIICNVHLKPNLIFIKISTVYDADELIQFLLPDFIPYYTNFETHRSDLINFSHYQIEQVQQGNMITRKTIWANAVNNYDGIYYENSGELHFDTFFNTWDCNSLVVFDPINISIVKK